MDKEHLERKVVESNDGSSTLFIPELNEHYHSVHGARNESMHVFIKMGLDEAFSQKKVLRIFEVGFGTGLNALLAFENSKDGQIEYISVEKYPLKESEWKLLNFTGQSNKGLYDQFIAMHACEWGRAKVIAPEFSLTKLVGDLNTIALPENIDVVFFDAFAPDKQPDLWTVEVFKKMFAMLNPQGILVTYSAKGQVRRNMIAAGFSVERLQGPPGKREMLRGKKE
jgi:tRNA U34 5-methylaminomethyl-2-thiouridine-forming methyltransferase MnmC